MHCRWASRGVGPRTVRARCGNAPLATNLRTVRWSIPKLSSDSLHRGRLGRATPSPSRTAPRAGRGDRRSGAAANSANTLQFGRTSPRQMVAISTLFVHSSQLFRSSTLFAGDARDLGFEYRVDIWHGSPRSASAASHQPTPRPPSAALPCGKWSRGRYASDWVPVHRQRPQTGVELQVGGHARKAV
jgi:hypothetical protein